MRRAPPGFGSTERGDGKQRYGDMRRIVVAFPEETFQEIRQRAVAENTSFAEQVRVLCEWGLLDAKEEAA